MRKKVFLSSTALTLSGVGTALFGKKLLWKIFSATRGKTLNGICESRAFLNWVAHLVGKTGIANGMKILRLINKGAWVVTLVGTALVIYSVYDNNKKRVVYETENNIQ